MRLLACAALLAAAACTPQFDPCLPLPGVVADLRILGVSADPPEAAADLTAGSVEPISLRVLVANPTESAILPVGLIACAADVNGDCTATSVLREVAPFDFEQAVTVAVPPDLIAAAIAADPLRGHGAPHVRLDVTVAPAGLPPLVAHKTLVFRLPDAQDPKNHGFQITGLRVRRPVQVFNQSKSIYPPWPEEEVVAPGDLIHFDRYDANWLRPVLAAAPGATDAIEEYDTTDLTGARVHVRERITYAFFASFGDVSGPHTEVIDPVPWFDPDNVATEPAPGVDAPGLVGMNTRRASAGVLWLVARDSRGAEAWAVFNWVSRDATLKDDNGNSAVNVFNLGPRCAKNQ